MALQKRIVQWNGVPTEYHRIFNIEHVVNQGTTIKVYSYINEDEREREKAKPVYSIQTDDIYRVVSEEELPYNDTLTVDNAYEYLKTLDKYSDAEDV